MSTDPRKPDGGYALTPDPDTAPVEATTGDATTAHHEELLRTEAIAARRGNRAVARFAVVGLVAALAVGVVTWRNTVPGGNGPEHGAVVDASAGSDLVRNSGTPDVPTATQAPRTRPPGTAVARPGPAETDGGIVPLHEDPYLPPNAWNGGEAIAPSTTGPADAGSPGPGDTTPTDTDQDGPWPSFDSGRPSLPQLPSTLPSLPGIPDSSTAPTTDGAGEDGDAGDAGNAGDTDGQSPSTEPEEPSVTAPSLPGSSAGSVSVAPSTPATASPSSPTDAGDTAAAGNTAESGDSGATGSPAEEPAEPSADRRGEGPAQ